MDKITAAEAAKILGYHRTAVHKLVQAGELHAERFGRALVFDRAEVEAFAARVPGYPRGRPRKPPADAPGPETT